MGKSNITGKTLSWFHKFVWYVWLPLCILIQLVVIGLSVFHWLSKLRDSGQNMYAAIATAYAVLGILHTAIPISIFIGFFRRRKYAWYVLMASQMLNTAFMILTCVNAGEINILICGITVLNILIAVYYWLRRAAFGVGQPAQLAAVEEASIICPACGASLPADAAFCSNCGTKVEDAAPPAD